MSSVAVIPKQIFADNLSTRRASIESALAEHLAPTLLLRERAAPLTVPTGISALDEVTGGLPRGALSELVGLASSGRTGVMLRSLAGATHRQEVCALVDASDSFDPASAAAAGVNLDRVLWVRCKQRPAVRRTRHRLQSPAFPGNTGFAFSDILEQMLKVADLLLQGGGFGMVVLDLGNIPAESVRRVPLTSWFRFRRVVEPTATVLLLIEEEPCAKTCASLVLRLQPQSLCISSLAPEPLRWPVSAKPARKAHFAGTGNQVSHAVLFRGMRFRAEVVRSWAQRKPPQSLGARFELRAALQG